MDVTGHFFDQQKTTGAALVRQAEPKLDGKHVVFGRVIEGIDNLSKAGSSRINGWVGKSMGKTMVFYHEDQGSHRCPKFPLVG